MKLHLSVGQGREARDVSFDVVEGATVADVVAALEVEAGSENPERSTSSLILESGEELDPAQSLSSGRLRSGLRVRKGRAKLAPKILDSRSGASLVHLDTKGNAKHTYVLSSGANTIGRGIGSTIVIDQPSVSRAHFRIVVGEEVQLVDLQSANGTVVDGVAVIGSTTLRHNAAIRAGNETFSFSLGATLRTPTFANRSSLPFAQSVNVQGQMEQVPSRAENGEGPEIYFNRPPRTQPRYAGKAFQAPQPPTQADPQPFSWAPSLIPLLMVGAMVALTGTRNLAMMGVFALMSPLMMVGSWWQSKVNARKKFATELARFRSDVAALEVDLHNEQETELLARRVQALPTDQLIDRALEREEELWVRGIEDADFLVVRVGEGDQPSIVTVTIPDGGDRVERAAIEILPTRFGVVSDVPVEIDLKPGGVGFAGSGDAGRSAVRSVLAQIAALHTPAEVVIAALLSEEEAPHWDWLKWLPHTRFPLSPIDGDHLAATPASCDDLLRRLGLMAEKRMALGSDDSGLHSWTVLLIDDRARIDRPTLDALLRMGPTIGVSFFWFAGAAADLTRKCHSVITVEDSLPVLSLSISGSGVVQKGIRADLLKLDAADRFSRGLAPIQDICARTASELDLPPVVLLSELLGGEDILHDVTRVHERWMATAKSSRTLSAPIGQAPGEDLSVDIVRQGPHGFLIGTTGSGKSELLRTLLISLAATYGPEKVNFLLIDFKGGAALKPFLELPHTIGLVTNLAEGEENAEAKLEAKVRRTIVWLRAELQRRMSILDGAGVSDISDMEKKQHPDTPPRLLIVADEFAVLAANKNSSSDDVIDEIVNIARLGRSLGIHLLLATQRAAGVITDNIRANTNLRIALRVQDTGESSDVVGSPAAAHISLATPGRAFVSIGAGNLKQVQTASSTGHSSALRLLPKVVSESFTFLGRSPSPQAPRSLPTAPGDNDLTRLARTIALATESWPTALPETHWAEPPAPIVSLASIGHEPDPFTVVLGLLDDPAMQRVTPATFDMRTAGNLLAFGGTRSGKTVLLRTAAASLAQRLAPEDLRLFGFDCAGRGLEPLLALPQTAAVVSGEDIEMANRLFRELRRIIDRRVARFAELGVADLAEYRRAFSTADDRYLAVVLLDGLNSFIERFGSIDGGLLVDRLPALLLEGRAAGVHFFLTANRRGGIPMAIASAVSTNIVLRLSNADDYSAVDIRVRDFPLEAPPGRGVYGKREFQAAMVTTPEHAEQIEAALRVRNEADLQAVLAVAQEGEAQRSALVSLGEWLEGFGWNLHDRDRLTSLPTHVVPSGDQPPLLTWQASVGLGDLNLLPVVLSLADSHAIVVGPPRSGRSSAVLAIAKSIQQSTPNVVRILIGFRRSLATDYDGWTHCTTTETEAAELLNKLRDRVKDGLVNDPVLVCFDDYSDLDDATIGTAFASLFAACKKGAPVRFVVASDSRGLSSNWNDAVKGIRRFRTGLLLQPDVDSDGDLVSARLPRQLWRRYAPGRGYLVQGTQQELVQVWHPGG
jgi:DNA segregation ATPase FtsK/SpoIIIE, S-DNA-T family